MHQLCVESRVILEVTTFRLNKGISLVLNFQIELIETFNSLPNGYLPSENHFIVLVLKISTSLWFGFSLPTVSNVSTRTVTT